MNDEHDADPDDVTSDPEPRNRTRIRALLAELGSGSRRRADARPRWRPGSTRRSPARCRARSRRGAERGPVDGRQVVPLRRRWAPRAAAAAAAVIVLGRRRRRRGQPRRLQRSSERHLRQRRRIGARGGAAQDGVAGLGAASTAPPSIPRQPRIARATSPLLRRSGVASTADVRAAAAAGAPAQRRAVRQPAQERDAGRAPVSAAIPSLPRTESPTAPPPRTVLYDGRRAVLVVHPERGGERLVEAWTCDGDRGSTAPASTPSRSRPTRQRGRPRIRQPQPDAVRLGP